MRICGWEKCSNSIEHLAKQARYCSTSCTDKARYARNGSRVRERVARYYAANRELVQARAAEWRRRHPDLCAQYQTAYRARRQDAPGDGVEAIDWLTILDWAEHRCIYCGDPLTEATMEHVVPLSRGGAHDVTNVGPACVECNCSKKDRLPAEWRPEWVAPWWIEYPVV